MADSVDEKFVIHNLYEVNVILFDWIVSCSNLVVKQRRAVLGWKVYLIKVGM